jgi:hypothetical protein
VSTREVGHTVEVADAPPGECQFDAAWRKCRAPRDFGSRFCEAHSGQACVVCGKDAVRECSATFQFVCGYPLCANCDHHPSETGG